MDTLGPHDLQTATVLLSAPCTLRPGSALGLCGQGGQVRVLRPRVAQRGVRELGVLGVLEADVGPHPWERTGVAADAVRYEVVHDTAGPAGHQRDGLQDPDRDLLA